MRSEPDEEVRLRHSRSKDSEGRTTLSVGPLKQKGGGGQQGETLVAQL